MLDEPAAHRRLSTATASAGLDNAQRSRMTAGFVFTLDAIAPTGSPLRKERQHVHGNHETTVYRRPAFHPDRPLGQP